MADFVQNSTIKTAVRELANPIADVSSFDTIVGSVITDNPFECIAYMTAGVTHDPVEKTKERYTARLVYEDVDSNNVGTSTEKYNTIAGFAAGVAIIMANAPLATAHGGTATHDPDEDSYSATIKCQCRFQIPQLRRDKIPRSRRNKIPRSRRNKIPQSGTR